MTEKRVLLIEDELMIQYLWEDICDLLAIPITGRAENVGAALSLIESETYDIAVLDVTLGQETSEAIATRLRELNKKVIVSTGILEESLPSEFEGFAVLSKPFSTSAMIEVLQRLAK